MSEETRYVIRYSDWSAECLPCSRVRRPSKARNFSLRHDVLPSKRHPVVLEKKKQLDATERFITLIICSTCFGHFYAHHQELETMCVITAYCVQYLGCWLSGVRCRAAGCHYRMGIGARLVSSYIPHPGRISCCPEPDYRQPATKVLHTVGGNNTHIVSSS